MIYISSKKSEEIEKIIRRVFNKEKIYNEYNKDDKIVKKARIIICDNNIEKIASFLTKNKKVLVYNPDGKNSDKSRLLKNRTLYTYSSSYELEKILKFIYNENEKKKRIPIACSIFLVIFLSYIGLKNINIKSVLNPKIEEKIIIRNKEDVKRMKKNFKGENIVFLGDSITDYYDLEKYYKNIPTVNSGIAGNQTKDIINDIYNRVTKYNPSKVFILIGTNDIAFSDLSNEELVEKIEEIAKKILEERPKAKLYIQSIYPISRENANIINPIMVDIRENNRIKEINKEIKEMCEEEKITYIDMYNILVNDDDNLTLDYTIDGLHMNSNGYDVVTKELLKYIYDEV